jgi:hypothetical protein
MNIPITASVYLSPAAVSIQPLFPYFYPEPANQHIADSFLRAHFARVENWCNLPSALPFLFFFRAHRH